MPARSNTNGIDGFVIAVSGQLGLRVAPVPLSVIDHSRLVVLNSSSLVPNRGQM